MPADKISRAQLDNVLRDFVENAPLYKRLEVNTDHAIKDPWPWPKSISRHCTNDTCRALPITTWTQHGNANAAVGETISYRCAHCNSSTLIVWAQIVGRKPHLAQVPPNTIVTSGFETTLFMKVGQVPAWSIAPHAAVERALSPDDLELYQRGLVCMSQAYGLGALAYFRRIVENVVKDLLLLVEEAARIENDSKALEAVAHAFAAKNADEKLKLIASTVPASLRPGGVNPLARVYDDYSVGIHALSDQECLEIAEELRESIEYVFGNLRDQLDRAKEFKAKIQRPRRQAAAD